MSNQDIEVTIVNETDINVVLGKDQNINVTFTTPIQGTPGPAGSSGNKIEMKRPRP